MTEFKEMDGHIFKPSLQDISLKRFRMRYSTLSNCYYLHWDNTVCRQLARIDGLENGAQNIFGLQRIADRDERMSYISYEQMNSEKKSNEIEDMKEKELDKLEDVFLFPPSISWKLDFSDCGLAIKSILIKARMSVEDNEDSEGRGVSFNLQGDAESQVDEQIFLGDCYTKLLRLKGSKSVTLTAHLHPSSHPFHLLPEYSGYHDDCPLDIIVNLMCLTPDDWPFAGELLLGLKYNTSGASESLRDKPDITVDCGLMGGQLQVHIVEGAGLVKEGSKKPYNSFVKCQLLPDPSKFTIKNTSPKHNAYPTWSKEFIFAGIDDYDLLQGGLEVLLYDHHTFITDTLVGGMRLSIPQKNISEANKRFSLGGLPLLSSPATSRSSSPIPSPSLLSPARPFSSVELSPQCDKRMISLSQPNLLDIDSVDTSTGNYTHFATLNQQRNSLTPSPVASPLTRRVPVFTIPRACDSPTIVLPHGSPRLLPKLRKSPKLSPKNSPLNSQKFGSDLLYWWMDSTGTELNHWQRTLETPGEWVYCWHLLRQKITPVANS